VSEPEPQPDPWVFPIEATQIMLFARAIGDTNPIYSDPEYARSTPLGGIIAPPTFLTAQFHFDPGMAALRPKFGEPWLGSGRNPTGLADRGKGRPGVGSMQAEQHYHYHRVVRPGDVLRRTRRPGTEWQKTGRRGGTLTFSDRFIEWRDQSGELVVTERGVSVRPSQNPTKEG
jgi:acyl dehydratase